MVKDSGATLPTLTLTNHGTSVWIDDQGEYWGMAHVFDPNTGSPVGNYNIAIAGVGQTYRLPPGGSTSLPVALPTALPKGTFKVVACVPELALASPVGSVTVS